MKRIDIRFQEKARLLGMLIEGRLTYFQTTFKTEPEKLTFITYLHHGHQELTDHRNAESIVVPALILQSIRTEKAGLKYLEKPNSKTLSGDEWYRFLAEFANIQVNPYIKVTYNEGVDEGYYPQLTMTTVLNPNGEQDTLLIDKMIGVIWGKEQRGFMRRIYENRFGPDVLVLAEAYAVDHNVVRG